MRVARTVVAILVVLTVHAAMWCAVPFILDGPLLPSGTLVQRVCNLTVMAAWLWGLPLAAFLAWERGHLRLRGA